MDMKRLSRQVLRWAGIALAILLGVALLLVIDPTGRLLGRLAGALGTALFVISIITMLLTFRTAKRLSPLALAFGALVSIATTLGFHLWAGASVGVMQGALAAFGGMLIGAGWSMTSLLFVDQDGAGARAVRARGDIWFLATWALTLLLPQLVAHAGARTPATLTLLSFLGMGLAIGNSGGLVLRARAAIRQGHQGAIQEVRS